MSAAEPHPRRLRALRRALVIAVAAGVVALAGPAAPTSAQILPTTTTAPVTTTTEVEPDDTTTTTEADESPTTTEGSTATTRATGTTQGSSRDDEDEAEDEGSIDEDVFDDDVLDDEGDVPGEDGVSEETSTTARDLLVSGDGSEGAESTTTTSTTVVEVAADEGPLDEETQIWLIVGGLVVVAVLIGFWTWRYWVRTRPDPGHPPEPDPTTVFRPR